MSDMYNKDYADDILRKLKQKILSENPESVDALEAFGEDVPEAEEDQTATSLYLDIVPEEGEGEEEESFEDFSFGDAEKSPSDFSFDAPKEDQEAPEEDAFGEVEEGEEDAFGEIETPEEDAFGEVVEEREVEIEEVDFWAGEDSQADQDSEEVFAAEEEESTEDDTAPWDIVEVVSDQEEQIEEPQAEAFQEETAEVSEPVFIEEPQDEPDIEEQETQNIEAFDLMEETDEAAEGQDSPEPLPAHIFTTRKRKLMQDPEESVVVQQSEEETDVLKRPLPRGQKIARSFFLHRHQKRRTEEEKGNTSITAWRTLVRHARLTFVALVIVALLTLFSLVLCTVPGMKGLIFNIEDPGKLHRATMLLDGGCLLVGLLAFLPAIIQGFKRLSDGVCDTELATAAVVFLAMVYEVVSALISEALFLVSAPFLFLLTLSLLGRFFMARAVQSSAEICLNSHLGTTVVLRRASDLPEVKDALSESELPHHVVMSTAKFGDTNAFLSRLEREHISSRYNWISLLGAIVLGGLMLIFGKIYGAPNAIGKALVVVSAAFPLSMYLVHYWSFYRLTQGLRQSSMTVAGESAVYELANADVVCLCDADAFPRSHVKLTHIKLCEDKRLDLLFVRLRALFAQLGGPLNGLFSVSGEDTDHPVEVSVKEITADGITAIVDGEIISVGKGAYMAQKGIPFMYDADDEALIKNIDTPIMFVATGGISSAKLYLRYQISEAFESYVRRLGRAGIGIIIRTSDPFITPDMIDRLSCLEKGSVGVVRSTASGKSATDMLSGGLIGYGTKPQTLYESRFLFSAYRRMQKSLPWVSMASIPLCGVLCALSAAAGAVALPLMAILYSILGALPALFVIEAVLRKYNMGDKK